METVAKLLSESQSLIAERLRKKQSPTLDQIAATEGVDKRVLKDLVAQKCDEIIADCQKCAPSQSDDVDAQIDFIYQVYNATRGQDLAITPTLDSFESFISAYAPDASPAALGSFAETMKIYIANYLHPSRLFSIYLPGHRMYDPNTPQEYYLASGNWVVASRKPGATIIEFIDRSVIDEVSKLEGIDYSGTCLFHATGSAALNSIAQSRHLYSARKAESVGIKVGTGERATYIGRDNKHGTGGDGGLVSVFASSDISPAYSVTRWFDEYGVVIGINREKLAQRLALEGREIKYDISEGHRIGDEVPIDMVEVIYAYKIHEQEVLNWIKENAPHAQFISLEAAALIAEKKSFKDARLNRLES